VNDWRKHTPRPLSELNDYFDRAVSAENSQEGIVFLQAPPLPLVTTYDPGGQEKQLQFTKQVQQYIVPEASSGILEFENHGTFWACPKAVGRMSNLRASFPPKPVANVGANLVLQGLQVCQ